MPSRDWLEQRMAVYAKCYYAKHKEEIDKWLVSGANKQGHTLTPCIVTIVNVQNANTDKNNPTVKEKDHGNIRKV